MGENGAAVLNLNNKTLTPPDEGGAVDGQGGNDYGVGAKQLAQLVEKRDAHTLQQLGGVAGLARKLKCPPKQGLQMDENDLNVRREVFGTNTYPEKPPKGWWVFVWEAMQDLTLAILAVCAVVSLIIGVITEGWQEGWYDGVGIGFSILLVVVVTATSDYQQALQFRDLDAEKKKIFIEVSRQGRRQKVLIFELLVGDIVHLSIGDQVPADGLYISGCGLSIDESSMTGESEPVKVNEESPFLLSGTKVQDGSGLMLVTGVGMNTEWGHLMATLSEGGDDETPLQVSLPSCLSPLRFHFPLALSLYTLNIFQPPIYSSKSVVITVAIESVFLISCFRSVGLPGTIHSPFIHISTPLIGKLDAD